MFQHTNGISCSSFIQELNDNEALNKTISIAIRGDYTSLSMLIFYGRVTLLESSRVQIQGSGFHYTNSGSYIGPVYQLSMHTSPPYATLYLLGGDYMDTDYNASLDMSYILYDGITFDAS